ncbi:uncharacterized protein Dwil_GK24487 [Drosophila willistoni]|uniref:SHSP domain-containing protein n=1 Tax=Drosophila willistoni TaxID=7260 RepID=B4N0F4_DROWI|nr:uncharacterized protein LOC6644351 [Drosophila willistoni]EDW77567.1 uncharacterized protein Dwil_GK24487 [Drosophila willistoni]
MSSSRSSSISEGSKRSISQEFLNMRNKCARRVDQLENDVLQCCRDLKKQYKEETKEKTFPRSEYLEKPANYVETDKFVSWHYDMSEFPVENMCIQLKNGRVHISAYFKDDTQSLDIKREFLIPDHVEKSKLTARLTPNGILTLSVPVKIVQPDDQEVKN